MKRQTIIVEVEFIFDPKEQEPFPVVPGGKNVSARNWIEECVHAGSYEVTHSIISDSPDK